ncbi:hypothetical protein JCM10213v2_008471 [Rhodosporidiobolus nylandii]
MPVRLCVLIDIDCASDQHGTFVLFPVHRRVFLLDLDPHLLFLALIYLEHLKQSPCKHLDFRPSLPECCLLWQRRSSSTRPLSSTSTTATRSASSTTSSFTTVTRSSSSSASTTLSAPTASATAATCSNNAYDQCGGFFFLFGSSCCPSGYTCDYQSLWYSQCVPSATATPTASSSSNLTPSAAASSAAAPTSSSTSACKVGGGGSDGCTPYSVSAAGVTLPSGVTWQDGGHVNYQAIPKSQYKAGDTYLQHGSWSTQSFGVHFESLNNQPSGVYIGKSFYDFSGAAAAFPAGYCITWVQVAIYNQHFGEGGQAPVCTA